MTASKAIEQGIVRQLLQRRWRRETCMGVAEFLQAPAGSMQCWADRLIAVLALTICLVVIGIYAEQLLWALLGSATVFALRD